MNCKKLVCLLLIPVFLVSCASGTRAKAKPKQYDCSGKLTEAIQKYQNRKFGDVITITETIKYQCGGHSVMDSVLYYMGMSYLGQKKFVEARIEFQRLNRDFPKSPFDEEVEFRIGQVTYLQSNPYDRDQSETKEAIVLLNDFIDLKPSSVYADSSRYYLNLAVEKLAEKEYKNALFYQRLGNFDAAIVYYKSVLSQYPNSKFVNPSQLNIAEILLKQGRNSEADELLIDLAKNSPDEETLKKIRLIKSKGNKQAAPFSK